MKKIFYILLITIILLTVFLWISIPDISGLKKTNTIKTSIMKYREAEWAAKGEKRRINQLWVPYSRISPYLVRAVIITEDDKFWRHKGFDYESIKKAIEKDLRAGRFKFGGSTISQQLAKNLYFTPEKSILKKIEEAIITWKLEKTLSKKRIIELYLNVVEWGDGIFGAEAASQHYFGKSAMDLTPMEAARLAVVLPNPRKLNPAGDQQYVKSRSDLIYSIMVKRGIVISGFEEVLKEVTPQINANRTEPASSPDAIEKDK